MTSVSALLLLAAVGGEYGQWAGEAPDRWPRIAMVNRIRYSDSNHPMAGSAFLLENPHNGDEIVAVTAKHVLRYFKSEAMDFVSFHGTLVSWEMFPKDAPADLTVVGALINEQPNESLEKITAARDWLVFTVESAEDTMQPLRLREAPLVAGETVFVVGWRYTDEGRQHVYRGQYVRADDASVLIDVAELVGNTIPGLSGAPVIDARGYVIGMMSSKAGKLQRLAPIAYPRTVLANEARPGSEPRGAACAQRMTAHFGQRGWIGVTPEIDAAGVISFAEVFADSPADKAGVRTNDILRGINGIPHDGDPAAFRSVYDSIRPDVIVVFELEREGERLSVEVRVEPIPDAVLQQWIRSECPP